MLHLRSLGLGLDEEGSAIPDSLAQGSSFSFSSSVGILLCFDLCTSLESEQGPDRRDLW